MWGRIAIATIIALGSAVADLNGQGSGGKASPAIAGTWQLEKGKVKADGPKTVIIRPDSSASWGKETVRWRLKADQIMIALGGEWEIYKLKLGRDRMTLSGGDLTEAITLKRVGPHTPRPDSIPIPPDPDQEP
ncbi:MAG: hypothetical protein SFV24_23145 [Gemmatimonadales bacterium]|nr:hypothetical protein [Gemmatimonadales bacterium]